MAYRALRMKDKMKAANRGAIAAVVAGACSLIMRALGFSEIELERLALA